LTGDNESLSREPELSAILSAVHMKIHGKLGTRIWWILAALALAVAVHHFILRPWFLQWGAPDRIRTLSLPGDFVTGEKGFTRAVLIEATPEDVWPWIMQLGQERGGMYSYDWLENLVGADIHNVYLLREDLQQPREQGDTIWLANRDHYNGQGYQVMALTIPERAFVMVGGQDYARLQQGKRAFGAWSIYLHPETENSTWLITRSAGPGYPGGVQLLRYILYEVPHFIMEKRMIKTIKRLAERETHDAR
jgi:hypothetical protein